MSNLKQVENYLLESTSPEARIDAISYKLNSLVESMERAKAVAESSVNNSVADQIHMQIQTVSDNLLSEIQNISRHSEKIFQMIASLENPEVKSVLECRYYGHLSYSQIGKKLYISKTKAQGLHREGLETIWDDYLSGHIE